VKFAPLLSLAVAAVVSGRSLLAAPPIESDLAARLAIFPAKNLPLDGEVDIRWNDQQVPFIFAESDDDAAFTIGLVHAHLRLGQMELMRHISQGRISEMVGPFTIELDHALRILNLGRMTPELEAALPSDTRQWLERFVAGINHYQNTMETLPHEFRVFGLKKKPWTLADIITNGRLAASDVSWLIWFQLWKLRTREDWPELWRGLLREGGNAMTNAGDADSDDELGLLSDLLGGMSRSGSNSVAVSPARSKNGHAWIANDPHLGFMLPNLWILAGVKCPSYHMVGMMIPGLPFVAVGRNNDIAWGGTNLRAASSDLFDVSKIPTAEIKSHKERIGVRWWFDQHMTVRDTSHGPVMSDSRLLEPVDGEAIALRWAGHYVSDEFSAMLGANRARNWDEFVTAFETFSVSAQNMVYADTSGNIGKLMAAHLPTREPGAPPFLHDPELDTAVWDKMINVRDLPLSYNPEAGFIVSANDRPPDTDVPVGYFFSPGSRMTRITSLLEIKDDITFEDLHALQTDVIEPTAIAINQAFIAAVERHNLEDNLRPAARAIYQKIANWDGSYPANAPGPVAFEAVFFHFLRRFYTPRMGQEGLHAFTSAADFARTVPRDIEEADVAYMSEALVGALQDAIPVTKKFATWGDMHRLRLRHPLGMIPVIGARFGVAEFPSGGSRQTIMKTNHEPTAKKHFAGYGSQARHISDMSDPDGNYFTLLGGQDGWVNSTTFYDQVKLWRKGAYVHLPLRPESVRKNFVKKMILTRK